MITTQAQFRLRARSKNRLAAAALMTAVLTAAAGCASPAAGSGSGGNGGSPSAAAAVSFPRTIAAANGSVRIAKRPTSIMSLSPSATEMLYAIGAGSQVTAVGKDSDYPAQAPRTSINALSPNIEAIAARKPDLVIVYYDATTLTKQLAKFSIPVLDLPMPSTLSDDYAQYIELGKATGHLQQAESEVATLKRKISAIKADVPHHSSAQTYYYELDQTYYSVTSTTFFGRLLAILGLKSIADAAKDASASGGYPQLSAEYILKANPDYIILADTICCHQSVATVTSRPGWSSLKAVRSQQIVALNDDIASRWGPRIIQFLKAVLTSMHPAQ